MVNNILLERWGDAFDGEEGGIGGWMEAAVPEFVEEGKITACKQEEQRQSQVRRDKMESRVCISAFGTR
jgi:hypothetical protein